MASLRHEKVDQGFASIAFAFGEKDCLEPSNRILIDEELHPVAHVDGKGGGDELRGIAP
jgi:hypothetical protein